MKVVSNKKTQTLHFIFYYKTCSVPATLNSFYKSVASVSRMKYLRLICVKHLNRSCFSGFTKNHYRHVLDSFIEFPSSLHELKTLCLPLCETQIMRQTQNTKESKIARYESRFVCYLPSISGRLTPSSVIL